MVLTKQGVLRSSRVLDELAAIQDKADIVEMLYLDAYEITFSPRRVGTERVSGGHVSDSTGERASCNCEAVRPTLRDDSSEAHLNATAGTQNGTIVHTCSAHRIRRASKEVVAARVALNNAVNDLQGIILGSDHHVEGPFEARDRQQVKPGDHGTDALDAADAKAKRIATDLASSFKRRLIRSGMHPMRAEALADRMRRVA